MSHQPYPGCEERIHQEFQNGKPCEAEHCQDWFLTQSYHDNCPAHGDPLKPIASGQCVDSNGNYIDAKWDKDDGTVDYEDCHAKGGKVKGCYCCCACYAVGTPIATPDGMKRVEKLYKHDTVSSASSSILASGQLSLNWSTSKIEFSGGTEGGIATMIFINYGNQQVIIVSSDHIFLMANGKFQRADRLVPLKDVLVGANGEHLTINAIHVNPWVGGLHHIATTLEFKGSTDGHLLNSNGVITGDYCLQVNQRELVKLGLMDDPNKAPVIGSSEYNNSHSHLNRSIFSVLHKENGLCIPESAGKFLTMKQASDITNHTELFNSPLYRSRDIIKSLFTVYKAFFPDINFYLDEHDNQINVYAFEIYGKKQVIISGKLLDFKDMHYEGYAFIIAQAVARLSSVKPVDSEGLSYLGVADFEAGSAIMRKVFYHDFNNIAMGDNNCLDQVTKLFSYITDANKAGDPSDIAHNPSIECRIKAIQNGLWGGNIPTCAGGPEVGSLKLLDVTPNWSGSIGEFLNLKFNTDLDHASVENLSNYVFSLGKSTLNSELPKALTANLSSTDSKVVELRVRCKLDVDYILTIKGLVSKNGSTLDPSQNSKQFRFVSSK